MVKHRSPPEVDLTVTALDGAGQGVAQYEQRTVRVRNALPGEEVSARLLKRRRGEWFAETVAVHRPAPNRRTPVCEVFPRCGGCSLQHLPGADQLELKHRKLIARLARAGVTVLQEMAPVAGPLFHYRSKARLGVRVVGGEVLAGFREAQSNRVVRMSDCPNLVPALAALLGPLRDLVQQLSVASQVPQLEIASGGTASGVCQAVILRHLQPLGAADLRVIGAFAEEYDLAFWTQASGPDSMQLVRGAELLEYRSLDFGLTFRFHPAEFTQVNETMNGWLVRDAVAALEPHAGSRVLDLFCGNGNFSLPLARRGAMVMGFEGSASAVARARANAEFNDLDHRCEFRELNLYDAEPPETAGFDAILVDPPRSGFGPMLERWVMPSVSRVVYVSCNPLTFADDARRLVLLGFELRRAGVYDMFPNTTHVESLAVFERNDRG
jgi:23S rRNA (uracil1939-C5)-methyltransferase